MPFTGVKDTISAWGDDAFTASDVLAPVSIGLGVLDIACDPVAGLVGQALDFLLDWLMDLAASVCPVLDALWGAPDHIVNYAKTVHEASATIAEQANQVVQIAQAAQSYTGPAADAQMVVLAASHKSLTGQSKLTANSADIIQGVGVVAGMVKEFLWGLVKDEIAKWVTRGIMALAASFVTFGAAIGAYTAWVSSSYAWLSGKVMMFLSEAADEIDDLAEALGINNKWLDGLEDVFRNAAATPIQVPDWVGTGVDVAKAGSNTNGTQGPWGNDPSDGITPFPA